jgi:hypothetical protein
MLTSLTHLDLSNNPLAAMTQVNKLKADQPHSPWSLQQSSGSHDPGQSDLMLTSLTHLDLSNYPLAAMTTQVNKLKADQPHSP